MVGWLHKVKNEIIKAWILSVYFAVFFVAISYFRFAVLKQAQVPYTDFWLGIVKAAVCAKFLLVTQAFYPIKHDDDHSLLFHIFIKSLIYVLIVTLLIGLEEMLVAKYHGKNIYDAVTGLTPGTIHVFFSLELLYWLMVIPYVVYTAIEQHLGHGYLSKLLMKPSNTISQAK